jgi:uncharacterized phage protein (TIGR01671 family)
MKGDCKVDNKFKVWCKNNNEWENDPCFLSPDGILYHLIPNGTLKALLPDTHIVVWPTGLRDSKRTEEYPEGQDIYEGDIVLFDDTGEEGYEYKEGFDFKNIAKVVFDLEKAGYTLTDFAEKENSYMANDGLCEINSGTFLKECEVIGNIYENPELLKEGGE